MSFADLKVRPEFVAALAKQGITEPTAIQVAALPVVMEGRDACLHAETGTGKTLAYLLPLFGRIDPGLAAAQVVIVAPTHELALQIQRQCLDLAQNAGAPIRTLLLLGGTSLDRQLDKLKKKPHVIVGSPGRIADLVVAGKLKLKQLLALVIDEADKLLGSEQLPAIQAIVAAAPPRRQLLFVSATEQPGSAATIAALAPDRVMVRTGATPVNANIEHGYLVCEERDKPEVLRKLLHALDPPRALVFVHQNDMAEEVAAKLEHHHLPVADLHGAFDKFERKEAMDDFRSGAARVLIASDIAARGLDLPGVTHVINLDVPTESKAYLHRVGRTGRAGAKGTALSLMTAGEVRLVARYERELSITLHPVRLREGRLIAAE